MKTSNLVSIIVPIYKVEEVIEKTLNSIVNQTYKEFELILVNDGTPDKSAEIARRFLKDKPIKWTLIDIPNGGVSNARNIGVAKANGDWIAFIDSDDFVQPDYVKRMLNATISYDADFSFCQYKLVNLSTFDSPAKYDGGVFYYDKISLKKIFLHRSLQMILPGMLIRKSILEKIEFDVNCPYSEDTLFTWELIYHSKGGVCVRRDLYNYYVRQGSKQHSLNVKNSVAAINAYSKMTDRLRIIEPSDQKFISVIVPKFILSAHHVLSKCVPWAEFKVAYKNTSKKGMWSLYRYADFRLLCYLLVYLVFPKLYYKISQ